jgi:ribosomal protein L23
MPIDTEKIKTALDDFENDDFISAKDSIKLEIKGAVSDYFKDKLDLQNDLEPKTDTEIETETDSED